MTMSIEKRESAFRDLCHYSPETVRNLRLALDIGSTPAELKRLVKGEFAKFIRSAIDHMAANPRAGVVRWNGMRYDWAEKRVQSPAESPP
jgi:hypothetical protein